MNTVLCRTRYSEWCMPVPALERRREAEQFKGTVSYTVTVQRYHQLHSHFEVCLVYKILSQKVNK